MIGPHWVAQGTLVGTRVWLPGAVSVTLSNSEKQREMLLEMMLLAVALAVPVHLRHAAPAVRYAGHTHASAVHVAAWIIGAHSLLQTTAEVIAVNEVVGVGSIAVDVGNKIAQSCTAAANC